LLIDLICGHADDWFTIPVSPPGPLPDGSVPPSSGVVVTLRLVKVRNTFDETDVLTIPPGRPPADSPAEPDQAPGPWSLFRTTGLDRSSLVIWPTVAVPLTGPVLDDVVLGVDEDANFLWATELMLDGQELALGLDSSAALLRTRRTGSREFAWLPSTTCRRIGIPTGWSAAPTPCPAESSCRAWSPTRPKRRRSTARVPARS
jgi:hypothetical protein